MHNLQLTQEELILITRLVGNHTCGTEDEHPGMTIYQKLKDLLAKQGISAFSLPSFKQSIGASNTNNSLVLDVYS